MGKFILWGLIYGSPYFTIHNPAMHDLGINCFSLHDMNQLRVLGEQPKSDQKVKRFHYLSKIR